MNVVSVCVFFQCCDSVVQGVCGVIKAVDDVDDLVVGETGAVE